MYSIGSSQLGGLPSSYNYLYQTSQILTQTSPYYYANHQNQGGFNGGYSRDYQMGFQSGSHLIGLGSLNYIGQNQGGSTSQLQGQQQQHQYLGQSTSLPENKQQQQQQQRQQQNITHNNRNSESHEKESQSKERSVKRNNSNALRERSNEKLSFNKSTPHFFPSQENQNSYNNSNSGGNQQSSNNSNNSGHVFMTSSSGNANNSNNNNTGSQTNLNLKDNDKINQIQKIYNNNIRSRNNFHKSQNNFYNTHSNAFFNSNSSGQNANNNGSLDQRKKNGNGLSSRLSQSPQNDVKMIAQQSSNSNIGQQTRKYYPSHQNPKFSSQVSSYSSQNQNPLTQFQKENNNLANIYSKEYKTNRNSLTSGKALEKKDTLSQIYKPQTKGTINLGNSSSKNSLIVNQASTLVNANIQSKFYQTEPNFNKKPSRKSLTIIKPTIKSQLTPIEDIIMNDNMTSQNQVNRKYFFNTSTNQNASLFNSQPNKWSLTPKQQFNSSNTFSKQKKKEEIIPIQKKSKTFGSEDRKNQAQGREINIENEYDYNMEYDEPFEQSHQSSKNPEQLYNYEIEIDQPLSSQLSKTKVLTQVDEETAQFKNSLATNEDTLEQQQDNIDNGNDQNNDKNKFIAKQQLRESFKKEDKNNNDLNKKDEDKIIFQKYNGYSLQQSNYLENRKSNNNFELEVIQEQNKEDEVKEVPADLLQQVQKISEARPKTSEGGRRRFRLKQLQQQAQENSKQEEEQQNSQTNVKETQITGPTISLAKTFSSKGIENKKIVNNEIKDIQEGTISSRRKNQSNGSEMYDLIESSPKQLDFSPLKTAQFSGNKEDYSNCEYEEDFDECESDQRNGGGYNNKNQFFRSQAEFYRPQYSENEPNYNATHYGGNFFKNSNPDESKKKQKLSLRKTTNEGFYQGNDQEEQQNQISQPKMYNLFKRNTYQQLSSNEDQQSIPSHRVAPNGEIPIEVHVQEDESEYVYQETSHRKKVFLKKKTIDTSDGHKIIIRHNKSAAGPKRVPKQQANVNNKEEQQQQQQQQQKQPEQKQVQPQDDVVERGVVPFKTGLDNEFINLFAQSQM